jgi:hypothetical protein
MKPQQPNTPQTVTATWSWTQRSILTKEQVEAITKKATFVEKIRLLFKPSKYTTDKGSFIRYKEMDGKIFVMKRGTRL